MNYTNGTTYTNDTTGGYPGHIWEEGSNTLRYWAYLNRLCWTKEDGDLKNHLVAVEILFGILFFVSLLTVHFMDKYERKKRNFHVPNAPGIEDVDAPMSGIELIDIIPSPDPDKSDQSLLTSLGSGINGYGHGSSTPRKKALLPPSLVTPSLNTTPTCTWSRPKNGFRCVFGHKEVPPPPGKKNSKKNLLGFDHIRRFSITGKHILPSFKRKKDNARISTTSSTSGHSYENVDPSTDGEMSSAENLEQTLPQCTNTGVTIRSSPTSQNSKFQAIRGRIQSMMKTMRSSLIRESANNLGHASRQESESKGPQDENGDKFSKQRKWVLPAHHPHSTQTAHTSGL